MSQSLSTVYIHLIFHIKTTSVAIQEDDQSGLNAYVAGTLNNIECPAIAVGGVRDHLHLLFRLSPKETLAGVVERVKVASHRYLESIDRMYHRFSWQTGYGAFSVSPNILETAKQYVLHQKEHHRDKDFSKEYLTFLRGYKVNFNEEYVFKD